MRWGYSPSRVQEARAGGACQLTTELGAPWPPSCGRAELTMVQITAIRLRLATNALFFCLGALACVIVNSGPARAASSAEVALRTRVEQCYAAYQQGDWQKVEKFLTKESKPVFRNQPKNPISAYRIQSVKIEPDGVTAQVVIQIPLSSTVTPRPIPVSKTTLWRLINRTWYMEVSKRDPNAPQQPTFEAMNTPAKPSTGPVYSRDLNFESRWRGLGHIKGDAKQVATFPFKNASTHPVTISDVELGCSCLTLKTQLKEYQPGESGTLEFEFDPSKLGLSTEQSFMQDVIFKTQPGGGYVKLTIAALVTPNSAAPTKP